MSPNILPPCVRLASFVLALAVAPAWAGDVTWLDVPRPGFHCSATDFECAFDYLLVPDRFPQHAGAFAIPSDRLDQWIFDLRDQFLPLEDPQPDEDALPARIEAAIGVGWMLDGIGRLPGATLRPLLVSPILDPLDEPGWRHLWIEDPIVGGFEALLFEPPGSERRPALLIAHGHSDDARSMIHERIGANIVEEGYVVLSPTFRVSGGSLVEDFTARHLLAHGFSLLALRVYEQALGLRILRSLPSVDADRIALVAHSGGSSASNLLIRLLPWVAAYVTDNDSMYFSEGTEPTDMTPEILDDTTPGLYRIHPALLNLERLPIPAIRVPYGLVGSRRQVRAFLRRALLP